MAHQYNDLGRIGVKIHPLGRAFPALVRRMLTLPEWIMAGNANYMLAKRFDRQTAEAMRAAFEEATQDATEKAGKQAVTVMREMVQSEALPPEEKTFTRLKNDAQIFIGAGMETTGRTLAVTLYHILANAVVHHKLREELKPAMLNGTSEVPPLAALETLPYLTAVLTEGIRIAHGTCGRLARIAPEEDLFYHGIKIPRGATMSQSSYLLHTDPTVFPEPLAFRPERFLGSQAAEAQKHMVPFGRGTRMCPGINLAWAELYLTIAVLVTSVRMELVDTTLRDATVDSEYFIGCLPVDSKGIRVRILGRA